MTGNGNEGAGVFMGRRSVHEDGVARTVVKAQVVPERGIVGQPGATGSTPSGGLQKGVETARPVSHDGPRRRRR